MRKYLLVLLLLMFTGCATIGTLHPGSGRTFEVNDRNYNEVWKAAIRVAGRNLTIVQSNKDSGIIKAEARVGLATWGEVVGIFITPTREGEKKYNVEVVSQKRSRLQITGQNWEETIVSGIKVELDI